MKLILSSVLILIATAQLEDAFLQLSESDPERNKLDWPTLSGAVKHLLCDVQSARQVEGQNHQAKVDILQRIINLHDRVSTSVKVDLAKFKTRKEEQVNYRAELDEQLLYRKSILETQTSDLKINEDDFNTMKLSSRQEMIDVSKAIDGIDNMRKLVRDCLKSDCQQSSFIEIQQSAEAIPSNDVYLTLSSSLKQLLQLDFKDRQVLKDLQKLLDQFWMITIDYRIELIQQSNRNQQLYEERRQTIEKDKEVTKDLYNSKVQEYNQVSEDLSNIDSFIDARSKDLDTAAANVDFYKNMWGLNEGIYNTVETALVSKANAIQNALKNVGEGISFQGNYIYVQDDSRTFQKEVPKK